MIFQHKGSAVIKVALGFCRAAILQIVIGSENKDDEVK